MKRQFVLLALAASPACAQGTITYFWDVNHSGSSIAAITPGHTVHLELWASWQPYSYGFAESIYEVRGLRNWDTGSITHYENKLDILTDHGDLQPDNDIRDIDAFALPPAFGDPWYPPPALLYVIDWVPDDYAQRTVRVTDANHPFSILYTDQFGSNVYYDTAPSEGAIIHVVPAPATLTILIPALLRRRR
ncbi:MAG: hypothetical protein IPJ41_15340 [Phycisphaerales bacterium]|nr:hypothetical protein [Phycisphaerales bacterium]